MTWSQQGRGANNRSCGGVDAPWTGSRGKLEVVGSTQEEFRLAFSLPAPGGECHFERLLPRQPAHKKGVHPCTALPESPGYKYEKNPQLVPVNSQ